tara:strand:+ start:12846 stop:13013 length:168 start_codon:yes stop_codon:yes gene_type:complete
MAYVTLETDDVVEAVQNYVKTLTGKRGVVVGIQETRQMLTVYDLEIKLEIDKEDS